MKKKNPLEKSLPDIGQIVRMHSKKKYLKQSDVARKAGWHAPTFCAMLKKRNWPIADLLHVGKVLDCDLLQYYYPAPPEGMVPASTVQQLQKELMETNKEIHAKDLEIVKLQVENKLLKDLQEGKK